ncbi:uncharacterized protein TRUGW13939_03461 [Talaromyces rugulosus]|uniref:RRM domain-containing protein n=1 Tax=Talaromyces rugulosus TaxID=121627 RepID=A0A7H8QQW8_TALRU|nr:uncharacterized protein TRUGW13939_03461 [Talaromyces rugulosus]QKX56360.1 hypothetical protein TRUGW13939_03461 [Talaromyces rugulosus]
MSELHSKRRRLSESGSFQAKESETMDSPQDATIAPATEAAAAPAKTQMRRELFVRSLPASATTESLTEFFSQSYVLRHATVVVDPTTKQSKGYGFVTFADVEDAQRALEELNGANFGGKKIRVEVAQPRKREIGESDGKSVPSAEATKRKEDRAREREENQPPRLIVRNLPWSISEPDQLAALFRSFGKVKHIVIPKKGTELAGFGFVVLRGKKNAEKALNAINGKEVDGRTLAVDWAVDKSVWEKAAEKEAEAEADADADAGADVDVMDVDVEDAPGEADAVDDDESIEAGSDEADEEEEIDNEDEDEDEEPQQGDVEDERNACTIFIRNLPFTTSDETLYEHFKQFGPVRYARIVMDMETERPRGTGFVCFWNLEDTIACVQGAPTQTQTEEDQNSKKTATNAKHSVLQNDMLDPTGKYSIEDRVLNVSRAVSKTQANKLRDEGVSRRSAQDQDKRRLFLLNEGTIASNSPLYQKLAPSEVKMREDSLKQRQNLIKTNPTLHLSLTRLSIRNVPRSVTSKDLKALAREAVVGFATDVKEGRRHPLSYDELQRESEETKEEDKRRREKGKGIVKQTKVVFEGRDGGKIDEKTGAGRSRGYGFIEYFNHRHALMGLRWLNGHVVHAKAIDGEAEVEKKKRLVVEFAIENAQVVQRRREFQEKARNKQPDDNEESDDENKRGLKRKRSDSRGDREGGRGGRGASRGRGEGRGGRGGRGDVRGGRGDGGDRGEGRGRGGRGDSRGGRGGRGDRGGRGEGREGRARPAKAPRTDDKNEGDDEQNKLAKRNRIIARKRQIRRKRNKA